MRVDMYVIDMFQNVQRVSLGTVPRSTVHQHMERTVSLSAIVQMVITAILLRVVLIWI